MSWHVHVHQRGVGWVLRASVIKATAELKHVLQISADQEEPYQSIGCCSWDGERMKPVSEQSTLARRFKCG